MSGQYDGGLKTGGNLEVLRRINALLDDTLDFNNLASLAQTAQKPLYKQEGLYKAPEPAYKHDPLQHTLDNAQWNYQDTMPYSE